MNPYAVVAVVLAGGESRRFGSDKLRADLHGRTVLDRALDGLPADAVIAVVGPERPVDRPVTFLREDPPGGGPAAGLIAGLRWALDHQPEVVLTLPGDAPLAGRAATVLTGALDRPDDLDRADPPTTPSAVVAVDRTRRDQVLQLALRPVAARQLIELAGPTDGHGQSVRRLVASLEPAPVRVELPPELTDDIDTVDQLRRWREPPPEWMPPPRST